jgi:hypothetical protein
VRVLDVSERVAPRWLKSRDFHVIPDQQMADLSRAMMRTDLTEPLGRYRSVVLTLSGLMAAGPFDVDREAAVDSLYRSEVLPALDDLQDNSPNMARLRLLLDTFPGAWEVR